jgi:uncharacterized protein YjhX (UPF0386 family)
MAKKVDGVIEAVRYKNGQILTVRAYERRGATFSDHILLGRRELLERIKSGKRFVIGERKRLMASTFEQGKPVQVLNRDGKDIISTHAEASRDELERTPVF